MSTLQVMIALCGRRYDEQSDLRPACKGIGSLRASGRRVWGLRAYWLDLRPKDSRFEAWERPHSSATDRGRETKGTHLRCNCGLSYLSGSRVDITAVATRTRIKVMTSAIKLI